MKKTIRFALVLTVLLLCAAVLGLANAEGTCAHTDKVWKHDQTTCWEECAECGTHTSEVREHSRYCDQEVCIYCGCSWENDGITYTGDTTMKLDEASGVYFSGNIMHGKHDGNEFALVWSNNTTQCYRRCSLCTTMLYADYHTHKAGCKGDADTCCFCGRNKDTDGIVLEIGVHHNYEWKHDETGCWQECADCGNTLSRYTHQADCTSPDVCKHCGATASKDGIKIASADHLYITYYSSSSNINKKYCSWVECMLCHDIKETDSYPHVTYCDEIGTCETCGLTEADGIEFDPVIRHRLGEPIADKDTCWVICAKCSTYLMPPNEHYAECSADPEQGLTCMQCRKSTVADGIVIKPENVIHLDQGNMAHDAEGHWPVCTRCNAALLSVAPKQGHCGLCTTTVNGKGTCYACGAENVELTEIAHGNVVFKANATEGWAECQDCKQKTNVHEHVRMCMDEMMYGRKICLYCGPYVQNEDDHMEFAETVHTNGVGGVAIPTGWYPSGNGCCLSCMACYAPRGEIQPHEGNPGEICKRCSVIIPEPQITVTAQPQNQTTTAGQTAKFTVTATGEGLTYQWQYRASSTAKWTNTTATGYKTATLTVPATASRNGYEYRCVLTDKYAGTITTDSAKLTITVPAAITAQPANLTAVAGSTAKFSVTATGDGLTYQWQFKTKTGSWTNTTATGYKTATVSIPVTTAKNGYQYRCTVTDKYGNSVTSDAATLTAVNGAKITAQPAAQIAAIGTNAKFTVTATGDGLTYQWQYRASSTGKWANTTATGYKTATLTVPATASRNGYEYRCTVTDQYGFSAVSDAAALTAVNGAKITTQPVSQTAAAGSNAKFTVTATGDGLTYQWQFKTATGSWGTTSATGNKTATLTVPVTTAKNGYQYRCVITDKYGLTATSDAATLTAVNGAKITAQPANQTAATGTNAKFTVTVTGDGLTYQWQYKTPTGSWTNTTATGYKTAALTVPATASRNGYSYRCTVTDRYGNTVTSNAATLTVSAAPALKITAQPANQTAATGTNAKFTVTATGDGLTYQWQYKTPTGSWTNTTATGYKTATLTVPATASRNGYSYHCIVKDNAGNTVTSNAATLTVGTAGVTITGQPSSQTAAAGGTVKFTVTASGDGLTYQWQYKTPSGSWTNSPAAGNTTASLSVSATASRNGYSYRCVVKDSNGTSATTAAATLTVK